MARRILGVTAGAIVLAILAGSPPAAGAGGLNVSGWVEPSGGAPGLQGVHYVTHNEHGRTIIREQSPSGAVLQSTAVAGRFAVPAVALDGSPGGLSADGSTLVLSKPRRGFPQPRTELLLVDTDGLDVQDRVTLKGDFGFDAISPDAALLYLIQYLSERDPSRYAVRAYEVEAGELVAEPIVDPSEEDPDEMRGYPITRALSPDGRWAYTLYDGNGDHPFVHALDTAEGRAACIDTPSLAGRRGELYGLGLGVSSGGSTLTVSDQGRALALIDTRTFEVRSPSQPPRPEPGTGGVWRLLVPAAVVAALAGGALALIARRRTHGDLAPGDA
jgi:hypothetical protein